MLDDVQTAIFVRAFSERARGPSAARRFGLHRILEDHRRRAGFALVTRFIVDGMRIEVMDRAQRR
jgi:hypothetical protein